MPFSQIMPNIESSIVEVCVFKVSGDVPLYLVLKRAAGDKLFPGIWQIVTGVIEKGEHAVHAVVREMKEETGLSPQRLWRLPLVNSFYDSGRDVIHLCPHFAAEVASTAMPRLSHEHEAFEWCAFDRAQSLLPWSGQRAGIKAVETQIVTGSHESMLLEIPTNHPERNLD